MRKLVLILLAFIAVITFIKAYDNTGDVYAGGASGVSATMENLDIGH